MNHSKHLCGLAEILDVEPATTTDFWEEDTVYTGSVDLKNGSRSLLTGGSALVTRWLFCKVVPYDEIRNLVDSKHEGVSATQMWNGMQ